MKKRILLFVLVMSIVLSLVCVMVACGIIDVNDDSDNTNEGGNDNDSTASFDYQASVVNTQLETMRQGNGYLIKYNLGALENTEATQITLGAKGDVYYVADGGHEYYYDVSNADHMDWYEKNGADDSWEKTTTAYSEYYTREQAVDAMRAYIAAYSSWMTYYQSFVSSMSEATKTSATVAGRSCDKFSFSAAAIAGEGLNMVRASYSCYVDKSTSICLKWEYSATVDGTTESWTLECVEFNTNPTITLPSVSGENIGGDNNQGGNGNTTPGGQGQGGSESGSQEGGQGSGSQGSGQEGGQQGGGNEGGESTGTSITADYPNATNSAIVDALIPNGFRVTYTLGAGVDANGNVSNNNLGTYTFAAKGDVYFIVSSNESAYFDFGESAEYYVDYRMQNGSWKRHNVAYGEDTDYTSADSAKTALRQVINSYMTLGAQYSNLQGLTKTSETYLSRAADKYAKKDVPAQGYEEEYLIKMDKQTGAVLFFYYNLYPAGTVDYTYVASHVATEFTVGYDVVLPEVASNLTTIGAKHSPDDVAAAMIAEAARENGLSVRLVNETDYSRDVYEIWIKNNKIKYTFFSEDKESGDTIADYVFYVDATVQGNAKVYECASEETPYELDGSYYYLYDGVEDFTDYVSIFGVLGDYWFCIEGEAALTEDVYHGSRNVDVYTFTEYEATMKIDQKTHAVLYYKEGDKDFATYTCEDVYTDFTDEIDMPVESV